MTKKRIAFLRIALEANCFSPVHSTVEDFRKLHWLEGDELLRACAPLAQEAKGFMRNAELSGFVKAVRDAGENNVEAVPLFSAWAVPAGPLTNDAFNEFSDLIRTGLKRAGKIDGVFFCMHGALGAIGVDDPETRFLETVREVLGNDIPIAVTHDLHANITQGRIDNCTILSSYHTNPHRDHFGIGKKAGAALIRAVRGEVRPTTAWRSLPMLLGGGATLDFLPPLRSIFRRMKEMEKHPDVISASMNMCHVWNDAAALGWSTVVVTNNNPRLAEEFADELAERCWAVRHELPPPGASVDNAIDEARHAKLARKFGTVLLADASDVVTAGAPGENSRILKALVEQASGLLSYVPMRDPHTVRELWNRGEGSDVTLTVGARLDPAHGESYTVNATLIHKATFAGLERVLVFRIGDVRLVMTEGPALAIRPSFYEDVGLDCWKADIIVVKNFFPFRLFFLAHSRKTIYVSTFGITDLDFAFKLHFDGPMHPRDHVTEWRDADRRRRPHALHA